MKKTISYLSAIALCILSLVYNTNAQISEGGTPPSFNIMGQLNPVDKIDLKQINVDEYLKQDAENEKNGLPHRCGASIPVELNIDNSGTWTELRNNQKLWQLQIRSDGALALGIYYDDLYLPKGAKLFLYNEDKTQVIGAFTHINNTESGSFATEMIQGEEVTLELLLPPLSTEKVRLSISDVAYFYRDVNFLFKNIERGFGDSDASCQVNINCSPEGDNWQDEKRGVARILFLDGGSYYWCTGSLVNNVREDCTPYFLTADHCGGDATSDEMNQWMFYFNYEASGCTNPGTEPSSNTIVGCTRIAHGGNGGDSGSDMLLVELNVSSIPDYYNPYYNGWNNVNTSSSSGVGIHHPAGDIKKISTYTSSLTTDDWNGSGYPSHWRLNWSATTNGHGVSEGGSSGSPLFDGNGRIVGTLTGGSSECAHPTWPDYYGKMSYHWESNGSNPEDQLKPWLDPDNTGATALDGTNQPCGNNPPTADFVASQTTILVGGSIDFTDMSSSAENYAWTFEGGTPGSSTEVNPTVTYNTVGTYDVSLTVTNGNGNDTETKTDYINVIDQQTSCDTSHYPLEGTPTIYITDDAGPPAVTGYLFGSNQYDMTAVAEYFNANDIVGYNQVEGALIWVYKTVGDESTQIDVNVWDSDGTGGDPQTILGTKSLTFADLNSGWNYIEFDSPITFTQPFYLGTTLPTESEEAAGDTIAYVSNTEGDTNPGSAWCIFGGSWGSYSSLTGGQNFRIAICAYICPNDPDAPPIADFIGSPTTTFINEPVDFLDLSINTPTSWSWNFSSGNPASSTDQDPADITWALPGFYDVSLTATNANGSGSETKSGYIEVREHTCEDMVADYTMGFETTEDLWEWKIEDANSDGTSWGIYTSDPNSGERAAKCYWNNDGTTASDDWLFTKCLTLSAGINYRISFYYRVAGAAYPQQMKVMIGDAQTSGNMSQQIVDLGSITNETYTQSVTEFSVSSSGDYYIGFHDYSAANMWGTFLDDINIEKYNNPPVADFVSDYTIVCEGESVSFADNSEGEVDSWSWSFPGGTPASSTVENPVVTYNTAGTYDVSLTATNTYGSDTETKTGYITVNPSPDLAMSFIEPSCNGDNDGTATAAASGATPPYTYLWDSSAGGQTDATATGLAAGTYYITVTDDGGCSSTGTVTITQPGVLQAIISDIDHVSCYEGSDGTATVSAIGGTSGYTYSWESGGTNAQETGLSTGTYGVTVTDDHGCTASGSATINQPAEALAGIISSYTDVTCHGLDNGTATVAGFGGTSPYTYEWQTGSTQQTITGLAPGSYTATVTDDNGCTNTATAVISEPALLVASASGTDVTCYGLNNGTATASASGGITDYSYNWSTGATTQALSGLAPDTYTVTVTDDNGCTDDASVEITQPNELIATASGTNVTCYGQANGTATVNASGGMTDYSYNWSSGQTDQNISGLGPDTYTVTITDDNGCTANASVEITQPDELIATASGTDVTCNGLDDGTATVSAEGGVTDYSYNWSTGSTDQNISGLGPDTYTVTVTDDNGCTDATSVEVAEPEELTVAMTGTTASCFGECDATATATPSGGTGTYSYDWNNGQTLQTATGLCGTTEYTVTVTDENSCSSTGVYTPSQPDDIILTMGSVNSTCNQSNGEVSVSASGGAGGFSYIWNEGNTTATVTDLPSGTYYVTVTDQDDCTATGSVGINDEGAPELTLTHTDASCYGGSDGTATVSATGGTGNYTYLWNDPLGQTSTTATGLSADTYTVSVTDDSGCMATGSETVEQADEIIISFTSTDPSGCDCTGEITVSATGGTGSLSYVWSHEGATTTTITGLCADTYTVTVSDENDCTAESSETITAPGAITIDSEASTGLDCHGDTDGTVTVTASGGTPPLSYDIGNGPQSTGEFTDLPGGTYTVTVTDDEGCTNTSNPLTVAEPSAITVDSEAATDVTPCFGDANGTVTVTASGGTGTLNYDIGDGQQSTGEFTGLSGGTYTVTITDENNCTVTSSDLTVNEPAEVVIESVTHTDVTSAGGSDGTITVTASGGTGNLSYDIGDGPQSTGEFTGLSSGTYTVTVTDESGCTAATDPVTITEPGQLLVQTSTTDVTCYGDCDGTASVTVSGGLEPYSYLWSYDGETDATITGLCADEYTVTVTDDAGSSAIAAAVVGGPDELIIAFTVNDVSCFGESDGSATANVSGGTPDYEYEWSTDDTDATIDNLSADTYNLTITDADGCTATADAIIEQPEELTGSVSGVDPSCYGTCNGSVSASAGGGEEPYTILWNNDSTVWEMADLCSGEYTATITDGNGCTTTISQTLEDPEGMVIETSSVNAVCGQDNGEVSVTASGGAGGYEYLWDDPLESTTSTVTGLSGGTYNVTVTDSEGCTATGFAVVNETGGPNLVFSHTDVSCYGGSDGVAIVTASGGTPPYTYLWDPTGQTNQAATGLSAGDYYVSVTDDAGCVTIGSVTIDQPEEFLVTIETIPASCYGECDATATVYVTGGAGSCTYTWNNGISGPVANGLCGDSTYYVTVTDQNACTATGSCTPGQPDELVVTITGTDPTCYGFCNGAATANATGGTGELSYIWDNGAGTQPEATELCGGVTYTVIVVDENGCSATGSFTPTDPAELTVTVTGADISCFGACDGTAEVTVSGGTPPFMYIWDNSAGTDATASDLCAGTYNITVTDMNACTATGTVTLSEPPELIISVSGTNPACYGECDATAEVTASGGTAPYSYMWDNDAGTDATASGLCGATTYTVIVTDSDGCTQSTSYTPVDPDEIVLTMSSTDAACGNSDGEVSVSATGGAGDFEYLWNDASSSTTATITGLGAGTYTVTVTDGDGCTATGTAGISETGGPEIELSFSEPLCNGGTDGTATATVTTGTPPYTYLWDPTTGGQTTETATGLSAGEYFVTVTDNSTCMTIGSVILTEPDEITISISGTDPLCAGECNGTIDVLAIGGTGTLNYLWDNGSTDLYITGLCESAYTVTVTDENNCTATESYTLTDPDTLIVTATGTDATCYGYNDAAAAASATGGTGAYSYEWSSGETDANITGLLAGTYIVTVTDENGCTDADTIVISEPDELLSAYADTMPTCHGDCDGSITVSPTGGMSPYTIVWSNGDTDMSISELCAGTYSFTITDVNGCSATSSVELTDPDTLTTTTSSTDESYTGAADGTATVTPAGGVPPYTYLWDANTGSQTDSTATGLNTGTYYVTVTDDNGCTVVDTVFVDIIDNITSIPEPDYLIYPNPTSGSVTIEMNNAGIHRIEVYDMPGKRLVSKNVAEDKVQLDLSPYTQGIYLIRLHTSTTVYTHKIILNYNY